MAHDATRSVRLKDGRLATISGSVEADAALLFAYLDVVARETDYLSFSQAAELGSVEKEREFIRVLQNPARGLMLKAVVEGALAGSGTLIRGASPRNRHSAELGISILQSYWGLGLGRALCGALMDGARVNGVSRVSLRVRADNQRAIDLYESLGFRHEGRTIGSFVVGDREFDEFLMAVHVDPI